MLEDESRKRVFFYNHAHQAGQERIEKPSHFVDILVFLQNFDR